jgi:SAM-dependent methyltransferase
MHLRSKKTEKPHWHNRRRYVARERIEWYGDAGDERYWYEYWKARLTDEYYRVAEQAFLERDELGQILLECLAPDELHLEAGCGAGFWVAVLKQRGWRIEGIEYARELVELVRAAWPDLPVKQGDALAIDCADGFYDAYLSIGVVEHRLEGPEPFLIEAWRVLQPGGRIIIAVPYFGPLRRVKSAFMMYERRRPALPFFQYGFGKDEFVRLLRKAGFQIEHVRPLYVHRLLQEELPGYDWLAKRAPFIRKLSERFLDKRDGHMLLMVGKKEKNV